MGQHADEAVRCARTRDPGLRGYVSIVRRTLSSVRLKGETIVAEGNALGS